MESVPDALPTVEQIHSIHNRVIDRWGLVHTGLQGYLVDEKLGRMVDELDGVTDPHLQSARLLKRLIAMHVYEDGNKRTAWLVTVRTLRNRGFKPAPDHEDIPAVLRHIGRFDETEVAEWLRTGEIDQSRLRDTNE